MAAILCIVGPSGSGKTLLLEALVRELSRQGWRVGAVKHAPHGFSLDVPGKDSWRLREAGAARVAVAGPDGVAIWGGGAPDDLDQVLAWLSPAALDLVLVEGFKLSPYPKIVLAWDGDSSLGPQQKQEVLGRLPPLASPEQAAVAAERLVGPLSAQLLERRAAVEAAAL